MLHDVNIKLNNQMLSIIKQCNNTLYFPGLYGSVKFSKAINEIS